MTAARPGTVATSHLASYVPDKHRYDELLDSDGTIRAHWRPLLAAAAGSDPRATVRRALDSTQRLVVENGVTYNVYADPKGADRPWALDPLPLVLPAAQWRTIDRGLVQRAALLDALLADLYGPQRLIAEGIVPAALPFGHPNFLWPAHGVGDMCKALWWCVVLRERLEREDVEFLAKSGVAPVCSYAPLYIRKRAPSRL